MKSKRLLFIIPCLLFSVLLIAQPGSLDEEFGTDGIVHLSFGSISNCLWTMAIQPDGKIIAAGDSWPNTVLARFTPDGVLDSSFGESGKVFSNFGFDTNTINAIALQPDGKIVAAATSGTSFSNHAEVVVIRYQENGSFDDTFNGNGYVIIETGFSTAFGNAIAVQPDGKIVVVARVNNSNVNFKVMVARFYTDGQLDISFGIEGVQLVSFGDGPSIASSMVLQPDGKIIVAGNLKKTPPPFGDFALARLNENGALDHTFGNQGTVVTQLSMESNLIRDLNIQPDHKIVAVGTANLAIGSPNSSSSIGVVRYHPNGILDSSFGNEGVVLTQVQNRKTFGASSVLQPDGKILVGGNVDYVGSNEDFVLVRYTPEGLLDPEFGNDGVVITEISASADRIAEVALQADGKIVAAGDGFVQDLEFVLVRYLSGLDVGTLDFSLTQNSILVYPNPIRESATLKYTLLNQEDLSLQLFDINGRLINTFMKNEKRETGSNMETFSFPADAPPGPYTLILSGTNGKVGIKLFKQ